MTMTKLSKKNRIVKLVVLAVDSLQITMDKKQGLMSFDKPINLNTLLDNIYLDVDHYHYTQRNDVKDQLLFHLSMISK